MLLNEAITHFEKLLARTHKEHEVKSYTKFIAIFNGLKSNNLTSDKLQEIENYLDTLFPILETQNKKLYYEKKYRKLTSFLHSTFDLVTEGYYAALGMTLGLSFGTGIGITIESAFGDGAGVGMGISFGAGIGMVTGMLVGSVLDSSAKKEGRVLNSQKV